MTTLTTPFGRRPATLAQIAGQLAVGRAVEAASGAGSNQPAAVNKWRLFRTLTEIRAGLGVGDRTLGLLNALLSFHPEVALSLPARDAGGDDGDAPATHCDLVVFPSNRALSLRAHGMSEATLRRHLAALVDAGLLIRRDSPNGKRYARKAGPAPSDRETASRRGDQGHPPLEAFGFDLTPLVARAAEFEAMAEAARRAEQELKRLRERVSLMRRDAGKLIALGLDEGLPGDWEALRQRWLALMTPVGRLRDEARLSVLAAALATLKDEAAKAVEIHAQASNLSGNDAGFERRQSNSNTDAPYDLEPASEEEGVGAEAGEGAPERKSAERREATQEPYPLGMVMEACPDLRDYAPGGRMRGWPDFLAAAGAVRPMIGISPDAWEEAKQALGLVEAHVVVATILQRSIHSSEACSGPGSTPGSTQVTVNGSPAILSPGGYLRALTEKARAGEFALGPVLMALIGQRLKARRAAGEGGQR